MFTNCFRCGQPGHTRRNCPQARKQPATARAAPAVESWKPPPPPVDRHAYPPDHWLLHTCPYCGKPPFVQCWNIGTRKEREPHPSRIPA